MATQLPTARGCRCELGRGKSRRICPSWGAAAGIREGSGGPSSPAAAHRGRMHPRPAAAYSTSSHHATSTAAGLTILLPNPNPRCWPPCAGGGLPRRDRPTQRRFLQLGTSIFMANAASFNARSARCCDASCTGWMMPACHEGGQPRPERHKSYPQLANPLILEWRLWHVSCFRNDLDVPTTSDDDRAFKYVAQSESFSAAEAKQEEVGSSNGEQEKNSNDGGWLLQVHKIRENLQGRILRFQTERWTVPWTGKTIAQVMILWIAAFWLVGSWIVPFLAHAAGFSKETLTHRGQALYSLLTDITEGLAGIAILHQCLGRFRPLPPGWFEFNLKGRWILDVALGCLFPLVNLLSHINISLVPMSQGPVFGVSSVEQSIVARDPVAMALYAVVLSPCVHLYGKRLCSKDSFSRL